MCHGSGWWKVANPTAPTALDGLWMQYVGLEDATSWGSLIQSQQKEFMFLLICLCRSISTESAWALQCVWSEFVTQDLQVCISGWCFQWCLSMDWIPNISLSHCKGVWSLSVFLSETLLLVENSELLVQHCGYPKHHLSADSGEDTQICVTILTPHQDLVKVIMELHFTKHVMN